MGPFPKHDCHVPWTYSDAQTGVEEIVDRAETLGLETVTIVVDDRLGEHSALELITTVRDRHSIGDLSIRSALEVAIARTDGTLARPAHADQADQIYITDRLIPGRHAPLEPAHVSAALQDRALEPTDVVAWLVRGMGNALLRTTKAVLAHPFSVLPSIGLDERNITDEQIEWLAATARHTGASLEVSERWRGPSARVVRAFALSGVRIMVGSGCTSIDGIGQFPWCRGSWERLRRPVATLPPADDAPVRVRAPGPAAATVIAASRADAYLQS